MAFETFTEVRKYLRKIPYIHDGGCAVAALVMVKWLEHKTGIKHPIVYGYENDSPSLKTNESFVKNGYKGDIKGCTHAFIDYGGKYIDCKGNVDADVEYDHLHVFRDYKVVEKSIAKESNWNDMFNRENIPILTRKVLTFTN